MTRLTFTQKLEIFNELNVLLSYYDIVLIDTAAGISSNVLYFNASANEIMVVVTPEPTSITDAYALMKIMSVKYQEKHFASWSISSEMKRKPMTSAVNCVW